MVTTFPFRSASHPRYPTGKTLAPSSSDATLEDDEAATREAAAKAVKAMEERAAEEVAAKEAGKAARKAAKAEQKAATMAARKAERADAQAALAKRGREAVRRVSAVPGECMGAEGKGVGAAGGGAKAPLDAATAAVGGDGAFGRAKRRLGSPRLRVAGESASFSGGAAEGVSSSGSVKRQRAPPTDENAEAVDGKSYLTFVECLRRAESMSRSKELVGAVHQVSLHAKKFECRVHKSDLTKRNLKRFQQLLLSLASWEETKTDPIAKAMLAEFPGLTSAPPA